MKEVSLTLTAVFMGLFTALLTIVADRIDKRDFSLGNIGIGVACGVSLAIGVFFMLWAIRIGRREDRVRNEEWESKMEVLRRTIRGDYDPK